MTENHLLTSKEVAARLGVTTRQVRRLTVAKKMPEPIRFDRWPRWPSETIERWIANGCPAQPAAVK